MRFIQESELYESFPSLEQVLTFERSSIIFNENNLELNIQQMESLGLIVDELYTNLAYLLSDQCKHAMKLSVYDNLDMSTVYDRSELNGSVLYQFEEAFDFIDKHNSHHSIIHEKYREDFRDYPLEAIREVLINALIHREYEIKGSVVVSMFDDCMTISSIGGLPKGLDISDILVGTSSRKNENLSSLFSLLKMVGTCGTGIPRIMRLYKDNPDKPLIEVSTNVFKITLPKWSQTKLSPDAEFALILFSEDKLVNRSDIEDLLNVSKTKAYDLIKELENTGRIKKIGAGRNIRYMLR